MGGAVPTRIERVNAAGPRISGDAMTLREVLGPRSPLRVGCHRPRRRGVRNVTSAATFAISRGGSCRAASVPSTVACDLTAVPRSGRRVDILLSVLAPVVLDDPDPVPPVSCACAPGQSARPGGGPL